MRTKDDHIEKARTSELLLKKLRKGHYNTNGTVYAVKYTYASTYYAFVSSVNPYGYRNMLINDGTVKKFANLGYIHKGTFLNVEEPIKWEY